MKDEKESNLKENLEAVGQIVLGEIEKIGGILTADPLTNAEGEYNIAAGAAHRREVSREQEEEEAAAAEQEKND
jgi:hypothetical protein